MLGGILGSNYRGRRIGGEGKKASRRSCFEAASERCLAARGGGEGRGEPRWKGPRRGAGEGEGGPGASRWSEVSGVHDLTSGPLPSVGPPRQTGCAQDYPADTVRDDYRNLGSRSI